MKIPEEVELTQLNIMYQYATNDGNYIDASDMRPMYSMK